MCKEIYAKFNKLLLNPFYNKKEFYKQESQLREKFSDTIKNLVIESQII